MPVLLEVSWPKSTGPTAPANSPTAQETFQGANGRDRRAGHLIDESGKTFCGLPMIEAQIHDIRDEAGKLLDQAATWQAGGRAHLCTPAYKAHDERRIILSETATSSEIR